MIVFALVMFIVNLLVSIQIGKLGKEKKIGYNTAFWLSFLLTPIIGLLAVIASIPKTEETQKEEPKVYTTEFIEKGELEADNTPRIIMVLWVLAILVILYLIFKK